MGDSFMTTPEDVERIQIGMFSIGPEDEAEVEAIEKLMESDIIQGFDPLRYEDHDPFANQNIPEGK
jgi:hypothetical protein